MILTIVIILVSLFVVLYILLKFNRFWIYLFFDNSKNNSRDKLDLKYEIPHYYKLKPDGTLDTGKKWPGWDGWYLLLFPFDNKNLFKMIRSSLMTGLYGFNGIDNYKKLKKSHLNSFNALENLDYIITGEKNGKLTENKSRFYQEYISKNNLSMDVESFNVNIDYTNKSKKQFLKKISGTWPDYYFEMIDPEINIEYKLKFKAKHIFWWADFPKIFTYYASFGHYKGTLKYNGNNYKMEGTGTLEHGFAFKPFNYDLFIFPFRLISKIFKCFSLINYNYELFVIGDDFYGGFMYAASIGIKARNTGGFYYKGKYKEIKSVSIKYLDKIEKGSIKQNDLGQKSIINFKKWKITALTNDGILEYTAEISGKEADVASNMAYLHFVLSGNYKDKIIEGRGYCEYIKL